MSRSHRILRLVLVALLLGSSPIHAQVPPGDTVATPGGQLTTSDAAPETDLNEVGNVLVVFLALSLVFESAMSVIFNWRWFLARFEGKGVKTPIIVITAFVVFWSYGLDVVHDLLTALGYDVRPSFGGQILTALLIAGGSDGIFRIFSRLNIRSPEERDQKAQEARAALAASKQKPQKPSSGTPQTP